MGTTVTIKPTNNKQSCLYLNPQTAARLRIEKKRQLYLSFGRQKQYANLCLTSELDDNLLVLSQDIIDGLYLPLDLIYEVRVQGNELIVGPYIGILMCKKGKDITNGRLRRMLIYTLNYSEIHGAIVVFALDQFYYDQGVVEGYYFRPNNRTWEKKIFPYPAAIYRRTGLGKRWRNRLLNSVGDVVFNNYYFNKREMYQWLSTNPDISPHLPDTHVYEQEKDVVSMLEQYGKVFIKPIAGMGGKGVSRISQEGEDIRIHYREHGENRELTLSNQGELVQFIRNQYTSGKYLVQQSINLLSHQGRVVDFRVLIQKNQTKNWVCTGMVSRYGAEGSIVSNISSDGMAKPVDVFLQEIWGLSEIQAFLWKERIRSFALKVCYSLEELGGNFGNLGLDVAVDQQGKMWLIEINVRDPDPTIILDMGDRQLYYTVKTNPILYAKALAGFGL